MCGYLQQLREGRDGARRDYVELSLDPLSFRTEDISSECERFGDLVEKFGPKTARFNQSDRP